MQRRDFISKASLAAAALGASSLSAQTSSTKTMSYTLAPLPYAHNALEPHIDQATMEIHHGKHHNAYVTNLNAALAKEPAFAAGTDVDALIADLAKVPESIRTAVRNNAGGHANHTFFWNSLKPAGGGAPTGAIATAIDAAFGDYKTFVEKFKAQAAANFGSGWTWLVAEGGTVKIVNTSGAGTPVTEAGQKALFTVDVWEHAYYLDYQNRRPDFVQAFFDHLANWDFANANLANA